jgi:hypothetical protein
VRKRHATVARASVPATWEALLALDLSRSRIVRALFALRGLPASAMTWQGLERLRFIRLAEEPPRELLLGIVGRFWTPSGHLQRLTPEEFAAFDRPRFAKAVWNFRVEERGDGLVELSTETRVRCTSGGALFGLYWFFVGPFSGWVRREMLRLIKEEAEEGVQRSPASA